LALEASGRMQSALLWTDLLVRRARSDLRAGVEALALALVCGDEARAARAAAGLARLDLAIPGAARRFETAIASACARVRHARRGAGGPLAPRGLRIALDLARSGPRAAADVARALI